MSIFNGKDKNGNLRIQMVHKAGLPNYKDSHILYMTLDEQNQQITYKGIYKNDVEIKLPISKIVSVTSVSEEFIKEYNGLGRAITGGLLFGPAGAIVGAVTAKDKKKTVYHNSINYISNGEKKSIVLGTRGDINEMKFFRKLSELTSNDSSSNKTDSIEL